MPNQHIPEPLISIITVCFNSAKTIRQTIESVLNQTYTNIEYILVDGKSTDDTIEIIKEYVPKFVENGIIYRWISEPDNGIYDAMNKGIKMATGEWVNFLNCGDLIFEQNTLDIIFLHLKSDLVFGNHAIYSYNPNKYQIISANRKLNNFQMPYCHQALFIRKQVIDCFPFDSRYKIAADYYQFVQCKKANFTISHIPFTIVLYLNGGFSSLNKKPMITEYYQINKSQSKPLAILIYLYRWLKITLHASFIRFNK